MTQDDFRSIDREDTFRKSAGDLGTFGLKSIIAVSGGATALLIGFRGPNEIVEKVGQFILPFTTAAIVVALLSIAFGYSSLQAWANSIAFRPKSDGSGDQAESYKHAGYAERDSKLAFWLYLASIGLLALAAVVGLTVLYCS